MRGTGPSAYAPTAPTRAGVSVPTPGPAGLLAGRLGIVNRTTRAYLVSVPLVTLRRAGGESVAPLGWNDASARIAQSPAGPGLKTYPEVSRDLAADQVLKPGAGLSGILLYPAADYTRACKSGSSISRVRAVSASRERYHPPPSSRRTGVSSG
jgi:hypothetical protein